MRMRTYRYKAYDPTGKIISSSIKAASKADAVRVLLKDGLIIDHIREISNKISWIHKDIRLSDLTRDRNIFSFTRDLSELMAADIKIDDALRIIMSHSKREIKAVCEELITRIHEGQTFSQALEATPTVFKNEYIELVRVGEQSGGLSTALSDLSALLERRIEVRNKIFSALTYPVLVMLVSVVTIVAVVEILIPSITPIFMENHKPLPLIIRCSLFVKTNILSMCIALVLLILSLMFLASLYGKDKIVKSIHEILLRVPFLYAYIEQREAGAFLRLFGVLQRAGVPLMTALISSEKNIGNLVLRSRMRDVIDDVRQGSKMAVAVKRRKALPETAIHFINVGEETGKLALMALRAAELFERQHQRKLDRIVALITPALTLGLSGFVGVLIFSVMNALMSINNLISR